MSLWSLFVIAVYAAETIISPLADGVPAVVPETTKPSLSFGQIVQAAPTAQPPQVLGATIIVTPTPQPKADQPLAGTPPPSPAVASAKEGHVTKKKSYTIAVLGDSMVDTLGPGIPHLKTKLANLYPGVNFTLLNYGVGGTNIDYGIERITNGYTYLGNPIPSLTSTHPDVVVLESFGYNPFPVADGINRHWMALAKAVDMLRANLPGVKIIIAVTIAPNSKTFGDGAAGLAFSPQDKVERTQNIKGYLASTVKFAASQHLPLADAYHASLDGNGDGILTYINGGDHIHYSDPGRALFAQRVADTILNNHILE